MNGLQRAGTSGPATVRRRAAAGSLGLALLSSLLSCAGDSQPDPPDMAGAPGELCPNDLPSDAACAREGPSYQGEVAPILEQRCATCHYRGNTRSAFVITDHDALYSRRQTVQSRIYSCVMPPEGAPALTLEERRTLLQWFVCGALEN